MLPQPKYPSTDRWGKKMGIEGVLIPCFLHCYGPRSFILQKNKSEIRTKSQHRSSWLPLRIILTPQIEMTESYIWVSSAEVEKCHNLTFTHNFSYIFHKASQSFFQPTDEKNSQSCSYLQMFVSNQSI